ncbi:MAG: hypothetical protein HC898_01930 [Phycisphaerales bacterium]|nr:hypothetical protein [Phycisphaerales bacterium]
MAEQDLRKKGAGGTPPGKSGVRVDREMDEFRGLMEPPSTFENGFTWPAFFGALFVAALMVPGVMYMGLLAGQSGSTMSAAQWVTVILFIEVARRANKFLKKVRNFHPVLPGRCRHGHTLCRGAMEPVLCAVSSRPGPWHSRIPAPLVRSDGSGSTQQP